MRAADENVYLLITRQEISCMLRILVVLCIKVCSDKRVVVIYIYYDDAIFLMQN